ncbi:twin-arginine translocation signal domain-containing protein, partial [Providencia rettgeri]
MCREKKKSSIQFLQNQISRRDFVQNSSIAGLTLASGALSLPFSNVANATEA